MYKISVIVPVYNVEQYLPRCLDSILEQTFSNFEIIAVQPRQRRVIIGGIRRLGGPPQKKPAVVRCGGESGGLL